MKTPRSTIAALLGLLTAALTASVAAQSPEPTPAFPGQTDAPAPARPSPPFIVETIATGLTGAWSMAFLPDGNFLILQGPGTMRIVKPNGFVSAPIAGVPPVKQAAAQGLHDVVLDPDFARNRTLYFTYFAPPPGEAPGSWPLHFVYEDVWTKSLAERRLMKLGMERVARARLSADNMTLEDVQVLAEGAERRVVVAPDGNLLVTGADRFRFYDSDLDGADHDFTDNPDIRRNFSGRVLRIGRDARFRKTTRGSPARRSRPKPSPTGCAIRKGPRSTLRPASCGRSITARRVATTSTSSAPEKNTAGPTSRTDASTTSGVLMAARTSRSAAA